MQKKNVFKYLLFEQLNENRLKWGSIHLIFGKNWMTASWVNSAHLNSSNWTLNLKKKFCLSIKTWHLKPCLSEHNQCFTKNDWITCSSLQWTSTLMVCWTAAFTLLVAMHSYFPPQWRDMFLMIRVSPIAPTPEEERKKWQRNWFFGEPWLAD